MATKIKGDLQTWPGGAVRISMPAKVANDLETFKKGVAAFAERLGCPECFSGFDCTFESERDFVLDADLKVTSTEVRAGQAVSRGAAGARSPSPSPRARSTTSRRSSRRSTSSASGSARTGCKAAWRCVVPGST